MEAKEKLYVWNKEYKQRIEVKARRAKANVMKMKKEIEKALKDKKRGASYLGKGEALIQKIGKGKEKNINPKDYLDQFFNECMENDLLVSSHVKASILTVYCICHGLPKSGTKKVVANRIKAHLIEHYHPQCPKDEHEKQSDSKWFLFITVYFITVYYNWLCCTYITNLSLTRL